MNYTPDAGDVVWLNFDPQSGREQKGHRPALVLSSRLYNSKSGLMLCCPITSQVKGYPFEVRITAGQIDGVVLVDHVRSTDWRTRGAQLVSRCDSSTLLKVRDKLSLLLP